VRYKKLISSDQLSKEVVRKWWSQCSPSVSTNRQTTNSPVFAVLLRDTASCWTRAVQRPACMHANTHKH